MKGFESEEDDDQVLESDVRKMVTAQNRKKKKSGGFQSMGRLALFLVSHLYNSFVGRLLDC